MPTTLDSPVAGDVLDGHALWWATLTTSGDSYLYFIKGNPDASLTLSGLFSSGGLVLERNRATDEGFVDYLLSELGDRATAVDVGRYSGALTWADPDASGLRTHNLYWFDGTYLMSLVAVRDPEDLVNLGRALACS